MRPAVNHIQYPREALHRTDIVTLIPSDQGIDWLGAFEEEDILYRLKGLMGETGVKSYMRWLNLAVRREGVRDED